MRFTARGPDMAGIFNHHGDDPAVNQTLDRQEPATITAFDARRRLIRRARQAMGLSQRELGQRVGLPQSRISQIETGDADLDDDCIPRIAAELGIVGQALERLLGEHPAQRWRQWIWRSRRSPSQKLVLLALLDCATQGADVDSLQAATGLTVGTVRALVAELTEEGLLRPLSGSLDPTRKVAVTACLLDKAA